MTAAMGAGAGAGPVHVASRPTGSGYGGPPAGRVQVTAVYTVSVAAGDRVDELVALLRAVPSDAVLAEAVDLLAEAVDNTRLGLEFHR
jgi:uncharacterized repeat protein (TIGR03917 family)